MSLINDVSDKTVRLPYAYGRHPVKVYLLKHEQRPVGTQMQVRYQRALGMGVCDALEDVRYDGAVIDPSNWHFHSGAADDAPDALFPNDSPHPGYSYYSVLLPPGMAADDTPDKAQAILRGLRVANFDTNGNQIDAGGSIVAAMGAPIVEDACFYSVNPALVIMDLIRRAKRFIGRLDRRTIWSDWCHWRDFNDVLIPWDDGSHTPINVGIGGTTGGSIPGGTYYARVCSLAGADISSPFTEVSHTMGAGESALTLSWDNARDTTGLTGYRVYLGTSPGAENIYFDFGVTNSCTIPSLASGTSGVPPAMATGALLRQIPRFMAHVFFPPPFDLATAFNRVLQISCADYQWDGGRLRFLTPEDKPTVFTYDAKQTGMGTFKAYLFDKKSRPNQVVVNCRDLDDVELNVMDPPVQLIRTALLEEDGGVPKIATIDGGGMYRSQAQRVCSFWTRVWCDLDTYAELEGSPRSYKALPADRILNTQVTPGWTDVKFKVIDKEESEDTKLGYPLKLQIWPDGVYSDTDHSPITKPLPPTKQDIFIAPQQVVSMNLAEVNIFEADMTLHTVIRVEATFAPYKSSQGLNTQRGRVYYKRSSEDDTHYIVAGLMHPDPDTLEGALEIRGVEKTSYDVKVVPESDFASAGISGATPETIPIVGPGMLADIPAGFFYEPQSGQVGAYNPDNPPPTIYSQNHWEWDASPDEGKGLYELWCNLAGATEDETVGGNTYFTGGTPSGFIYKGKAREVVRNEVLPESIPEYGYLRLIDPSGGRFSRWIRAYLALPPSPPSSQDGPVIAIDSAQSTSETVTILITPPAGLSLVDSTLVEIRQSGGTWPSDVPTTSGQRVFPGIAYKVTMPWSDGGTVQVRAMYRGTPDSDWSNIPSFTFPSSPATVANALAYKGHDAASGADLDAILGISAGGSLVTQLASKVPTSRTINTHALTGNISLTTDDISEGATNKYYTDARVDGRIALVRDNDVTLSGNSSINFATQHAVKTYVDNQITGLKFKQDVRVASTANVNVSSAPSAIDGVTLSSGDRVLLKNQTSGAENGAYIFNGAGNALTRSTDADSGTELVSATFPVREGTFNQDTWWTCTNDSITLGTTALVFSQTGGAGTYTNGAGLSLTGNSFSVATGGVTNAMLAGSIAYSKLSLTGAIQNSDLAGGIAASKLVGSDIATVGTITTGTWNATKIDEAHGGTNQSTYTLGDLLYASAANTLSKLAGNATSTKKFLTQTGTGSASAAPAWGTISQADVGGLTTSDTPTFAGITIGSSGVSSSLIPSATDTYDLGSSLKLWRKGWLAELDAVLFAQNVVSVIGGWLIVGKNEGTLPADVNNSQTTINFGQAMTPNDFVLFRAAGQVEYVQVGTLVSGTTYNVTRDKDGSGANSWPAGSVYLVNGNSGDGRIEINSNSTPRISVITQGATYNAQTELLRMGDLNGNWGYSGATYGFAAGDYTKSWITIDSTNGLRIGNNTTVAISLTAAGNASFTGSVTATSGSIGGWNLGSSTISSGGITLAASATAGADKIYIGTGTWNNTNTPFYVDGIGSFSLGNKLTWDAPNSLLTINGGGTFTGTLSAATGTFAGSLTAASGSISGSYSVTGTLSAASGGIKLDSVGLTFSSAASGTGTGYITWKNGTTTYAQIKMYRALSSEVSIPVGPTPTQFETVKILNVTGPSGDTGGYGRLILEADSASATSVSGGKPQIRLTKYANSFTDGWSTETFSNDEHVVITSSLSNSTTFKGVAIGVDASGFRAGMYADALLDLYRYDAVTNALTDVQIIRHNSSGTVAANFGSSILFKLKSSTAYDQDAARIGVIWTTATHGSRTSAIIFQTINSAGSLTERVRIDGTGNVGIGAASSSLKTEIYGIATNGDARETLGLYDTTAVGAGVGGGIAFGGKFDATGTYAQEFASIKGYKENSTNADYAGALAIQTRANGGSPTTRLIVSSTGGLRVTAFGAGTVTTDASGNFSASDPRLKDDLGLFTRGLEDVLKIESHYFRYKKDNPRGLNSTYIHAGFFADETFPIPEAIGTDADGYHNIEDRPIIAALCNAIKELKAEIETLRRS